MSLREWNRSKGSEKHITKSFFQKGWYMFLFISSSHLFVEHDLSAYLSFLPSLSLTHPFSLSLSLSLNGLITNTFYFLSRLENQFSWKWHLSPTYLKYFFQIHIHTEALIHTHKHKFFFQKKNTHTEKSIAWEICVFNLIW